VTPGAPARLRVDVWSDVVCPWCYIGAAHLKVALRSFEAAASVDVVWRAFELDPAAPAEREGSYVERLARKYRVSDGEARAMVERVVQAGQAAGLDFRFDVARAGNTFDAHRLLQHALAAGGTQLQSVMEGRLFRAYFTDGLAVGDRDVLASLAEDTGVPDATAVLASDRFGAEVRADEAAAAAMGITGVPFFLVDETYGLAGAHRPENLLQVLQRAWSERAGAS
jgi:predicted DsbA family dithiol-disulfide isomerase